MAVLILDPRRREAEPLLLHGIFLRQALLPLLLADPIIFVPVAENADFFAAAFLTFKSTHLRDIEKDEVVGSAQFIKAESLAVVAIQPFAIDAEARHARAAAVGYGG